MKTVRVLLALAGAALLATCSDGGPAPGWLRVTLSGPAADNAGVLLTLSGGAIDSVRTGYPTLYTVRPAVSVVRLIVGGDAVSGLVAEIAVPDVSEAARYSGVVDQVVAAGTFGQRDPAAYRLTIRRP